METEGVTRQVQFRAGRVTLEGTLTVPLNATAVVIFAHGSGSSRFSPRNVHVANVLQKAGFATLLFDLLTKQEEFIDKMTSHLRFDIDLLTNRLLAATGWIIQQEETKTMRIGYFGASTGAAAALAAAAQLPRAVGAVVSRGGRPDLAADILPDVSAPTLLIVGGNDLRVIEMNRSALAGLHYLKKIEIVPNAGHLFEEPGALDMVAQLADDWFATHLIWETGEQASTAS